MKTKRSFFEKLTGAVKLEEEDLLEEEERLKRPTRGAERVPEESVEENDEDAQLTVDVYDAPNEIIIKTMVAGVKPEDLDVSITRDSVTIRGTREEERTTSDSDYIHKELYWGSFSRTIALPEEIDVEEAEAIEKYGLMIIRMPKIDKNRQTKLKVKGT